MKMIKTLICLLGCISILSLAGCGSDSSTSTVPVPELNSISLSLEATPFGTGTLYSKNKDGLITHVDTKTELKVKGHYNDGSVRDVTDMAKFHVYPGLYAEFNENLLTAKAQGTVELFASIRDLESSKYTVEVIDANVTALRLYPKNRLSSVIENSYVVEQESETEWVLIADYDDGTSQKIHSDLAEWQLVDNYLGSVENGMLTVKDNIGKTTLNAKFKGILASVNVLVSDNDKPFELQARIPDSRSQGMTFELKAFAIYDNVNEHREALEVAIDVSDITYWRIENCDTCNGEVELREGLAIARKMGKIKLSGRALGKKITHEMIIEEPALENLIIVNEEQIGPVPHGKNVKLKALGKFTGYEEINDVTDSVFWSVDKPSIFEIIGDGRVKAIANAGNANVIASLQNQQAEISLEASDAIPISIKIKETIGNHSGVRSLNGSVHGLRVFVTYSDDNEYQLDSNDVTWSTSEGATVKWSTSYGIHTAWFSEVSGTSVYTARYMDLVDNFIIERIDPLCKSIEFENDCIPLLQFNNGQYMTGAAPLSIQLLWLRSDLGKGIQNNYFENKQDIYGPLNKYGVFNNKSTASQFCASIKGNMNGYLYSGNETLPDGATMSKFWDRYEHTIRYGKNAGVANLGFLSKLYAFSFYNWVFNVSNNDGHNAITSPETPYHTVMCVLNRV